MHFDARLKPELFEQSDAINGPARARDSDHDFQNRLPSINCVLNSEQKRRAVLAGGVGRRYNSTSTFTIDVVDIDPRRLETAS